MSKKISEFSVVTSFEDGDLFNIVRNSTNYGIDSSKLATYLGAIGSLNPVGAGTAVPVLNQPSGTINNIRGIESGNGIIASVSADDGINVAHNFTFDSTGVKLTVDENIASPVIRSIVAGSGIATAASGNTVVISASAVGASNTVIVNQESDFPTAVGGVITLADNTNYIIAANVTTANRFVLGVNNAITANNVFGPVLTYTGSGTMFTGVDKNLTMRLISINCPSGIAFDLSSPTAVGGNLIYIDSVAILSSAKVGVFDNLQLLDVVNSGAFNTDQGFEIKGTTNWSILSMNKMAMQSLTSATLIGIDFGTSVHKKIQLTDFVIRGIAGAIGLKGAASSANLVANALGKCIGGEFTGVTPLDTINENDIRWAFQNNTNINDTIVDALTGFNANATETVISVAATPVVVNATWVEERSSKFTLTAGGRATYDGERDDTLPIDISVGVVAVGGGNKDASLYLAVNGTVITSTKRTVQTSGSTPRTWSIPWQLTLTNGDYVEAFIANDTDTGNLIVEHATLRIN